MKRMNRTEGRREREKKVSRVPIYKKYLHLEFKRTQHFYIYTFMYIYISTA